MSPVIRHDNFKALDELECAQRCLRRAHESCGSPQARELIGGVKSHLGEVITLQRYVARGSAAEKERLRAWQAGEPRVITGRRTW